MASPSRHVAKMSSPGMQRSPKEAGEHRAEVAFRGLGLAEANVATMSGILFPTSGQAVEAEIANKMLAQVVCLAQERTSITRSAQFGQRL